MSDDERVQIEAAAREAAVRDILADLERWSDGEGEGWQAAAEFIRSNYLH